MLKSDIFPECPVIFKTTVFRNIQTHIQSYTAIVNIKEMYAQVSLRKVNVHFMKDNNSEVSRSARNKLPEKTNVTAVIWAEYIV